MQINIPENVEAIVRSRATAAGFESVEEYVWSLLGIDAARHEPNQTMPYQQWHREFQEFLGSLKPGNPNFDDSRESIYPDR